MRPSDSEFAGSIPENYERFLGPALFEPYAADLAERVAARPVTRVLEIAAGTGIVTRALRDRLPREVEIVATDLNPGMLAMAERVRHVDNVRWEPADATSLPFEPAGFDAVVCQFGLMFFPDKARSAHEVRRVLRPGGRFIFNVWSAIERNPVGATIVDACHAAFPDDPPRFYERGPYGYHDVATIEALLAAAGFSSVAALTLDERCRSTSASDLARGICEGNPLYTEIVERDPNGVAAFRERIARALAQRFGAEPLDAPMQAHVFTAS